MGRGGEGISIVQTFCMESVMLLRTISKSSLQKDNSPLDCLPGMYIMYIE
jgi:hypothetical protein